MSLWLSARKLDPTILCRDVTSEFRTDSHHSNGNLRKPTSSKEFVDKIKISLYAQPDARRLREGQLRSLVLSEPCVPMSSTPIIERLISEAMDVPAQFFEGEIVSQRILHIYSTIKMMLSNPSNHNESHRDDATLGTHEICDICGEDIKVESLLWARCGKGHQYGMHQ